MVSKILKTKADYNQALKRLDEIFHTDADSPEGDEAKLLMILIEKYKDENYPIDAPGLG